METTFQIQNFRWFFFFFFFFVLTQFLYQTFFSKHTSNEWHKVLYSEIHILTSARVQSTRIRKERNNI